MSRNSSHHACFSSDHISLVLQSYHSSSSPSSRFSSHHACFSSDHSSSVSQSKRSSSSVPSSDSSWVVSLSSAGSESVILATSSSSSSSWASESIFSRISACLVSMLYTISWSISKSASQPLSSMQNLRAMMSSSPAAILCSRCSTLSSILSSILLLIIPRMKSFAPFFIGPSSDSLSSQSSSSVASSTTPAIQSSSAYSGAANSSRLAPTEAPASREMTASATSPVVRACVLLCPLLVLSSVMSLTVTP